MLSELFSSIPSTTFTFFIFQFLQYRGREKNLISIKIILAIYSPLLELQCSMCYRILTLIFDFSCWNMEHCNLNVYNAV